MGDGSNVMGGGFKLGGGSGGGMFGGENPFQKGFQQTLMMHQT